MYPYVCMYVSNNRAGRLFELGSKICDGYLPASLASCTDRSSIKAEIVKIQI